MRRWILLMVILGLVAFPVGTWAEKKITDMTENSSVADDDWVPHVDKSDTTEAASGTTKKATVLNFLGGNLSAIRALSDPGQDKFLMYDSGTGFAYYTPTAYRMLLFGASGVHTEVEFGTAGYLLKSAGGAALPAFSGTAEFDYIVLPYGANPTTDAAGEAAIDTSAAPGSMFRWYGDAAYAIPAYQSISSTIKGCVAADDYPLWKFPYAITIKAIKVYVIGGTNVVGGLDECTGTLGVCTSVTAVDADITGLPDEEVADDGSLTNGAIAAGNYIRWRTTSVDGTNTSITVTIYYTVDQVN